MLSWIYIISFFSHRKVHFMKNYSKIHINCNHFNSTHNLNWRSSTTVAQLPHIQMNTEEHNFTICSMTGIFITYIFQRYPSVAYVFTNGVSTLQLSLEKRIEKLVTYVNYQWDKGNNTASMENNLQNNQYDKVEKIHSNGVHIF